MQKYIYDEKNGLCYERQGDYFLPCLLPSDGENKPVGMWGQCTCVISNSIIVFLRKFANRVQTEQLPCGCRGAGRRYVSRF